MDLPRMVYHTAEEARVVASGLGLDDVHSTRMDGELVFLPGSSDSELRSALRSAGKMVPGHLQAGDAEKETGPLGGTGHLDELDKEFYDDNDEKDSGLFGGLY